MGSKFKQGMFEKHLHLCITGWADSIRDRPNSSRTKASSSSTTSNNKMVKGLSDVELHAVEPNIHSINADDI